jgi:hypothetical protein
MGQRSSVQLDIGKATSTAPESSSVQLDSLLDLKYASIAVLMAARTRYALGCQQQRWTDPEVCLQGAGRAVKTCIYCG